MEIVVAVYGAALATVIAVAQGLTALRRRARINVKAAFTFSTLDQADRDSAHGTPLQIDRDGDRHWNEANLRLAVSNRGGSPVQIVAVVIESLGPDGLLNIQQFAPAPLPHVLDPGTQIEIVMQKEPIDMLEAITFFGVADAMGRRHAPSNEEVRSIVQQSWNMPTRVHRYVRRDDPTAPPVLAYQNRERSALIGTAKSSKNVKILAQRSPLLTENQDDFEE